MTATIRLRTGSLAKYMAVGQVSNAMLAERSGVAHSTVARILRGIQAPGERFIAGLLGAFPDLTFDDLFQVVVEEVA